MELQIVRWSFLNSFISARQMKQFSKDQNNRVIDPNIKNAVQQAEDALSLTLEQRKELVNCLPSDEEENGEDPCDETMLTDDESPKKESSGQKRKNSGGSSRNDASDEKDDDEVTGRKVKEWYLNFCCRVLRSFLMGSTISIGNSCGFYTLILKSDRNLISPYSITPESHINVMRIKKMITK